MKISVRKWAVIGVIVVALACVATGDLKTAGIAVAGLVGFLKNDEDG